MSQPGKLRGGPPVHFLAILLIALMAIPGPSLADDLQSRLASGEIIVSSDHTLGATKQGEVCGVVDAPPGTVWQVIIDVSKFREFMPRTVKSQVVAPEQLRLLQQTRPATAPEVEAILGVDPPAPTRFRIPGQKYVEYVYGHLRVPWPVGNRWYIIKMLRDETQAAQQIYTSSWSLELGNLRENRGQWLLEPFGDRKTRLTYRLATDPGGAVPKFLLSHGTFVAMPQVISAIRQRIADLARTGLIQ